jgi:hypothetical protein
MSGQGAVAVNSPYATETPNLAPISSLSSDGRYVFFWRSGRYALATVGSGSAFDLPSENDPGARRSGLWAGRSPLVAYWGFANGNSALSVTNAANGQTITLDSGRSAPITPLAWRPGTTQLVYRNATNFVQIADVGCLESGCGANPLEQGTQLFPATATDVQIPSGDWAFFRDGETVQALNLSCINEGNCLEQAVTLGQNAAPSTWVHVAGNTLAYTAYTQDATNPNDREVRAVDLTCLGDPGTCQAIPLLLPAVAGLLSPNGMYLTVDEASGGLQVVQVSSLNLAYLSGSMGGALGNGLNLIRWE